MLYITDFHSHLLPETDDGSRSVEESLQMLERMGAQGVNRVVASPHFYANDESVDKFLSRRNAAFERLKPRLGRNMPQVVTGAELRYYEGVSRLEGIEKLCIEGTALLLLEMPERPWSEYILRELTDLACRGNIRIMLAHVERCLPYQSSSAISRITDEGILMQLNAEAFEGFGSKRKALRLLKEGCAQFIGSDSHNMTDRAPNMNIATDTVREKFGEEFLTELMAFGNGFFEI